MDQINKALLNQLTQKIGVIKGMQMSDEEIEKSFDKSELDIIEKAMGEGSRGGKIIGHTKSGKPIYESFEHEGHKDFSEKDHRDAAKLHQSNSDDIRRKMMNEDSDESFSEGMKKWKDFKENQGKHEKARVREDNKTNKSLDIDIEKSEDSKEKKVAKVMKEFKEGKLKSSSGDPVTDRDQAIAIAMSEAGIQKEKSMENDIEKSNFEDILKSHLNDLFYSENMKIKKSGKEFKEALNKQLLSEQAEIKTHREKLSKLIEEIGEQPTEKFDSWSRDGWKDKIMDFPMVYKNSYNEPVCESTGNSQQASTTQDLKNKYSDCARQYVDDQKEIYYINTMLNSIKDNEAYTFNVRQATLLGF